MKKVLLTENELVGLIKKVMGEIGEVASDEKRLLEFAKKIHLFENKYLNKSFDIKTQREYVNNLIPKKESVLNEYFNKFDNMLLTESKKGSEYINNFFDFLIENARYPKKEIVLSETWERTPPGKPKDPIGYWKILFDNLKTGGIGVKWEVANDPVKSTFMYWGGWVIWKDLKKNGGFPISWTDVATKTTYYFKFDLPGSKYAGNAIDKTKLLLKNVAGKYFTLMNVGKSDAKTLKPFFGKCYSAESIGKEEEKTANTVFSLLTKSFDQDSDGIWNDYDGTDENGAVAAMNKISSRGILDKVNAKIKAKGYYKDITSWVEAEMSDIDPTQLDAIRTRLSKLGYRVPEKNNALRAVGKTKEAVNAAWDWAKTGVIGKFFNGLRDTLNTNWAIAAQLFLDALGPETLGAAFAVPMFFWSLVNTWNQFNVLMGTPEWENLIFDSLNLVSAGAMTKVLKPFKGWITKAVNAVGGTISSIFGWLVKQVPKLFEVLSKWFPSIVSAVSKLSGWITKAAGWISNTLKKFIGQSMATKLTSATKSVTTWITDMVNKLGQWIKGKVTKQVADDVAEMGAKSAGQKLFQKGLIFLKKKTGWKWLYSKWVDKGLRAGMPEIIDNYILNNLKNIKDELKCGYVEKQFGQVAGDFCRFAEIAQTPGNVRKDLVQGFKTMSSGEINDLKSGFEKISSGIETAKNIPTDLKSKAQQVYDDYEGVRKDKTYQYKKTNDGYYYSLLTQNPPKWTKLTNPVAIKNLSDGLYSNYKSRDIVTAAGETVKDVVNNQKKT